jgi:hypothetical protein
MKKPPLPSERKKKFRQLARRLASLGWISEGYAQNRGPGAGGPCFQWTRKVKGKTVSVALSQEQFEALDGAIRNWRWAQSLLKEMQAKPREIFTHLPESSVPQAKSFRPCLAPFPTRLSQSRHMDTTPLGLAGGSNRDTRVAVLQPRAE